MSKKNINVSELRSEQLNLALQALKFYADPLNYHQGESFAELSRITDLDLEYTSAHRGFDLVGGKTARKALIEIQTLESGKQFLRNLKIEKKTKNEKIIKTQKKLENEDLS